MGLLLGREAEGEDWLGVKLGHIRGDLGAFTQPTAQIFSDIITTKQPTGRCHQELPPSPLGPGRTSQQGSLAGPKPDSVLSSSGQQDIPAEAWWAAAAQESKESHGAPKTRFLTPKSISTLQKSWVIVVTV